LRLLVHKSLDELHIGWLLLLTHANKLQHILEKCAAMAAGTAWELLLLLLCRCAHYCKVQSWPGPDQSQQTRCYKVDCGCQLMQRSSTPQGKAAASANCKQQPSNLRADAACKFAHANADDAVCIVLKVLLLLLLLLPAHCC
jgi:hypothetical protein